MNGIATYIYITLECTLVIYLDLTPLAISDLAACIDEKVYGCDSGVEDLVDVSWRPPN